MGTLTAWFVLLSVACGSLEKFAIDFLEHAMSREQVLDTSAKLISQYLPIMPERSSVVSPITLDALVYNDPEEILFYSYSALLMEISNARKSLLARSRPDFMAVGARLHLLNLYNKFLLHFSAMHNLPAQMSTAEVRALRMKGEKIPRILNKFFDILGVAKGSFPKEVVDGYTILHQITLRVRSNDWNEDAQLRLIPRIAHNLLEYATFTNHILCVGDAGPVFSILEKLHGLLLLPQITAGILRNAIPDMDRKAAFIRAKADISLEVDHSHAALIASIAEMVADLENQAVAKSYFAEFSTEQICEKSASLLAKYLPVFPLRGSIVSVMAAEELLLRDPRISLFEPYAALVLSTEVKTRNLVADMQLFPVAARLHVLNIINKLAKEFATLTGRKDIEQVAGEVQAVAEMLTACFSKFEERENSFEPLFEGIRITHEIVYKVYVNEWQHDANLMLIPRVAHNVLEFITLTSHLVRVRDPQPAFSVLEKLHEIVSSSPLVSTGPLRRYIASIDRSVDNLRREASLATMLSQEQIEGHSILIGVISGILDTVLAPNRGYSRF